MLIGQYEDLDGWLMGLTFSKTYIGWATNWLSVLVEVAEVCAKVTKQLTRNKDITAITRILGWRF